MKKILVFLVTMILLLPSVGCYAHGPWRGKVVEKDTKKPIEGAVVVAVWYKTTHTPAGSSPVPLKTVEQVTNKDGEFYFSSKYFVDILLFRDVTGPDFLIYKPGYGTSQEGYSPNTLDRPIYKKELAIFELPRAETNKDRLKAWDLAREFNRNEAPKLNEFLKMEEKNLVF